MQITLFNAKTATATSDYVNTTNPPTFQASMTGSGAVSATVIIEVSNDLSNSRQYVTLATFSLSGTDTATDGFATTSKWEYYRARLTAISGTSAAVTVTMSY